MNDPVSSMATDYSTFPNTEDAMNVHGLQTSFRTEHLGDMTYTQFLILVREGHVDRVQFNTGMKTVDVTTKESAPGRGRSTERVGLIWDPDLYEALCAHGVSIEIGDGDKMAGIQAGLLRMLGPILLTVLVIGWALSLGRKPDTDDPIFGGARMELIRSKDVPTTFADVAGIDDIRDEIMEVVSFLQNQELYLELGARSPAGVLLCGPPGTGKTLLAKAIAGEAGVPFFNSSGADFHNMFVGVGAARIRDMFVRARRNAPCVLFIDEFDGIGQARTMDGNGSEDNVQTINQLLTELDGFEDNTGVVVLAATNRPSSLDEALTRPGRFDRIITIPYPNLLGRVDILKVHARDKPMDEDVNFNRIARATAGFSGAELMNLMNMAAIESVRMERDVVTEDDVFNALEKIHTEKYGNVGNIDAAADDGQVTPLIRRTIATYMAAKALMGLITPMFDELQKVVVTPSGAATGYVYFIPQDAHLETEIVTRSFMESHVVVKMAGRVAEVAVMGAANVTTAGAGDIESANEIAREMIFRCGWSQSLGPLSIAEQSSNMLDSRTDTKLGAMGPVVAGKGLWEIQKMIASAEAKAYFGLVMNWELLEAMVDTIMTNDDHSLTRVEIGQLVDKHGLVMFKDGLVDGFSFNGESKLEWPEAYNDVVSGVADVADGRPQAVPIVSSAATVSSNPDVHPLNPYAPSGAYEPMSMDMLGPESVYFRPEAWEYHRPDSNGNGTNGSKPTSSQKQSAEPSTIA